jgi:hypothetical protein
MTVSNALVVTTISGPNKILQALAQGTTAAGWDFIAIGDTKSPERFELPGCRFYSVDQQLATALSFAKACPTRHYARKNIGYLLAARAGITCIVETDDDNVPRESFFAERRRHHRAPLSSGAGWVNAYRWFTDANIWPRGLPLDVLQSAPAALGDLPVSDLDCPIQQGLADGNPDVDAIYRLVLPLPISFEPDRRVALGNGSWTPFNSQNTTWFRDAFPLLYLPAYCSFRMTDIWRSFVAQRIAWENGWSLLFHEATVWQDRNEHNILKDFEDEISGYLNNRRIADALGALPLKPGLAALGDNLRLCYEKLVSLELVGQGELALLDAWLSDLNPA